MKNILASIVLFAAIPAMAQDTATAEISSVTFSTVLLWIIGVLSLVMFLVVFALYHVVNMLRRESLGLKEEDAPEKETEEVTFWEKLMSLKPISAEKDIEIDHEYDGIKELNNPIPAWFNVLFYGTIIFAVAYMVVYHISESAPLQTKEYENELVAAKVAHEEYIKTAGNVVDENNVTATVDATLLAQGKETYVSRCAVCHGNKGEGGVGPNLTDEYWLHGGDVKSIFKTIKYGVPAKGMVAWQSSLSGGQMQDLASYILTLQGTNPEGAKEPQGEIYKADNE